VLDLCAAPGGKSTHLLSLLEGRGVLISNEIIANRNATLRQNVTKWGAANSVVTQNDPKDFQRLEGLFDLIVVDAPCSGEGMFRKDNNAIAEWSQNNVETCIYRQEEILNAILPALKPGGFLIYSTCTFEPGENINRMEWLTKEYRMQCISPSQVFEENGVTTITSGEAFGYSFYPHKTNGEGFFIAALQKPLSDSDSKKIKSSVAEKVSPDILQWIKLTEANAIIPFQEEYHLVSRKYASLKDVFRKSLRIKQEGTIVCTRKGKDLIPSPELAFSYFVADTVNRIEVSYDDAIRILKCENLHFTACERGWHLVTFQNLGLAWVKVMDNRTNNYYPNNWRILK
jgi:NOL1/NOP2/fmu family ribosome biogenesis protein